MTRHSLPCAWRWIEYAPGRGYTFRWGRKDGYMDVLRGNHLVQGQPTYCTHSDEFVVARIPVRNGWAEDADIIRVAMEWLEKHQRRG